MAINKIVYFLHCHFLEEFDRPLVGAKIEAWEHGPVFRELYREFKQFGEAPIDEKATMLSPVTGERVVAECELSDVELSFVRQIAREYLPMSASALRALSHEAGGPWDQVWNHSGATNATMRITDDSIRTWFRETARH